jgi:hypothetical protein
MAFLLLILTQHTSQCETLYNIKQRNIDMKKILFTIMAAMACVFTGCNNTPSVERMTTIATAIGKTAGVACELAKTKTEVKEGITIVLNAVQAVVPTNGQTFVEAWTPIIEIELQKLVDAGKINAAGSSIAKFALGAACEGIDYIFIKYPKACDAKELVSAAVTGFVNGYKSVIGLAHGAKDDIKVDEEAMKYIKAKLEKAKTSAKPVIKATTK